MQPEAPGHHPETRLLATLPVGAVMWRIVEPPILYQAPERFGVRLVAGAPVGSDQIVGE